MESLSIRSMPKMLQEERKIEREREISREREREEEIYIHVSAARGRTTLIYLYTSLNVKLIHRFINQSIPQSPIQNHELPHPHSNSSLHNSRVMRCTHPNSSSSYSSSSSSPHTHHKYQSQQPSDYLFTNTKTKKILTTGMHGRHRRSRPWKWNLLPRNCRKWNRSDL